MLKISLSQTAIAQPPYVPVLRSRRRLAGTRRISSPALSFDNYALHRLRLALPALSYLKSLEVAAVSTAILLLIGFPLAYGMARAPRALQPVLFMLVVLPFWTSFLIRIYAWINILQRDGLLNQALLALGIVDAAAGVARDRHRGLYRHRLFLPAVHGAAASTRRSRRWTRRCSKPPPISAVRAGRRSGW